MAAQTLSCVALCSPSTSSRLGSDFASSYGQHVGTDFKVQRSVCCSTLGQDDLLRHGLSAVLSEPVTEASPANLPDGKDKQDQGRGRGGGGRKFPKVHQLNGAKIDRPSGGPKLEWLKQEGIDLTSGRTISRVNRAISQCSSVTEALGVIEEMKAAGLTTTTEGTYLALITVCRRQQQGERALSILEAMKKAGVKPGMLTYNTLISCCQQAQRLEDAFRIKVEMESTGMKPDVVTYTTLMSLLVKASPYRGRSSPAERLEKAMDLYKEMLDCSIQADVITFNTLMYAGAQAKLPGKVLEVYRMMIAAGVSPNQFTFGTLLESFSTAGRLKSALEVFNEMRAAGIGPQTSTYNFLLGACAAAPQPSASKAWELFEEMKKADDVTPNSLTFSSLIIASSKGGDHAGAVKAYKLMQEAGALEPKSPSTFNKLIHSASMTGGLESAFQVYEKMREEGYKPDVITYSTLLSACARADDLQRALAVGEDFGRIGIQPNQAVLHSLMGAFGKADRWEDAVTTFRSMSIGEEQPTALSYSIVFDACFGHAGVDAVKKHQTTNSILQMDPGIEAAVKLYYEAVAAGIYKNYTVDDLSRCDLRDNSRAAIVVALLAWLKSIRAAPPVADLVIVVGSNRGKEPAKKTRKGKVSWKYSVVESTLQSVGLQCEQLSTITMEALTVKSETLKTWLTSLVINEEVQAVTNGSDVVSAT